MVSCTPGHSIILLGLRENKRAQISAHSLVQIGKEECLLDEKSNHFYCMMIKAVEFVAKKKLSSSISHLVMLTNLTKSRLIYFFSSILSCTESKPALCASPIFRNSPTLGLIIFSNFSICFYKMLQGSYRSTTCRIDVE